MTTRSLTAAFVASACAASAMELDTDSFKAGGPIPAQFATHQVDGGADVSPSLRWSNLPTGTKSIALTCVDKHSLARNWVHWMIVNIPIDVESIKEGATRQKMPAGAVELENSFGYAGWGGPQPPKGSGRHYYIFTVYALDLDSIDLKDKRRLAEDDLKSIMENHILGKADFMGIFSR